MTTLDKTLHPAIAAAEPAKPEGLWIFPSYANTNCWDDYQAGTLLGRGGFGTTYRATKKGTTEEYAVKMISKRKLQPEEVDFVRHEVTILHHLRKFGNSHIIEIKKVYEDKNYVCLVMEVCNGGELLDAIINKGSYSEQDAARLLRTIVEVVDHCHRAGVIHRDIKPENFLLSDNSETATLKAIDFGLSQYFTENQVFTEPAGSLMYMAPEVLAEQYGKQADLWSCGVMLYLMLSGRPPFTGRNDDELMAAVETGTVDLTSEPWPSISDQAKDCVRRLLERDPAARASAPEILRHPWLAENGVARSTPVDLQVLKRLKAFAAADQLKREAMRLISARELPEEAAGMKFIWQGIKRSGSKRGFTAQQFLEACRRKGVTHLTDAEILLVFNDVTLGSGDGMMDFEAFAAANTTARGSNMDHLTAAFNLLDVDGDGKITEADLEAVSKMPRSGLHGLSTLQLSEMILNSDLNRDGSIDFGEFISMLDVAPSTP